MMITAFFWPSDSLPSCDIIEINIDFMVAHKNLLHNSLKETLLAMITCFQKFYSNLQDLHLWNIFLLPFENFTFLDEISVNIPSNLCLNLWLSGWQSVPWAADEVPAEVSAAECGPVPKWVQDQRTAVEQVFWGEYSCEITGMNLLASNYRYRINWEVNRVSVTEQILDLSLSKTKDHLEEVSFMKIWLSEKNIVFSS